MALLVEAHAHRDSPHIPWGGFDASRSAKEFGVPEDFQPMSMNAIGHAGSPEAMDPDLRERKLSERVREPLSQILFEGSWAHLIRNLNEDAGL